MMKKKKFVLSFDLDNTLIENRSGIVNSFNYALRKFNITEIAKEKIEKMIGIPLEEMFSEVSEKDPSLLAFAFREFYKKKGIYQSRLLSGVKNKLSEFKKEGFTLGIITSKKQEIAENVVKYLNIDNFFDYIIGETEERKSLGKLDPKIKEILLKKYPGYKIIIIGDHPKDAMLSNNLNCPFIGVLTGTHTVDELKQIKSSKSIFIDSLKELSIDKITSLF
ncbi:MAG: HAD family hydrolase [Promethearchaeota archaeon]